MSDNPFDLKEIERVLLKALHRLKDGLEDEQSERAENARELSLKAIEEALEGLRKISGGEVLTKEKPAAKDKWSPY